MGEGKNFFTLSVLYPWPCLLRSLLWRDGGLAFAFGSIRLFSHHPRIWSWWGKKVQKSTKAVEMEEEEVSFRVFFPTYHLHHLNNFLFLSGGQKNIHFASSQLWSVTISWENHLLTSKPFPEILVALSSKLILHTIFVEELAPMWYSGCRLMSPFWP